MRIAFNDLQIAGIATCCSLPSQQASHEDNTMNGNNVLKIKNSSTYGKKYANLSAQTHLDVGGT